MSTDLEISRRLRKQAAKRAEVELRDTAKKYNRWSPRKEEISINLTDLNNAFPDFTGGTVQSSESNNNSKLVSKLARLDQKLDQDHTPCRVPKSKMSERLASMSKKNSRFNPTPAVANKQPANTPKRVVQDILDDHEFSLDLSHPIHNKENILPRQRPRYTPGISKYERLAQAEADERQVLAELEGLIKEHPANSSIRSNKVIKVASPALTMSTTVNGSFAIPEVQNITRLVDNTSASLPKKIEGFEQPTHPMGKEEIDIYRSIDELQQQVAMLLNERKERDSVISSLRSKLNEREEQAVVISSLKHERKEQDDVICSLKQERKEQDNLISTLRTQNQHMAETIHHLENNIRTQQVENGKIASNISGSEAAFKLLQSQKAEMEKAMAEISSTNDELRTDVENMVKQRDMVLSRYRKLVERFDNLQNSANAETSQPKEHNNIDTIQDQSKKNKELLNAPNNGPQAQAQAQARRQTQNQAHIEDEDEDDVDEDGDENDTADVTMRPTMEPHLALQQIMANVHNQIERLSAQHSVKAAELRSLDKSKNLRLRKSISESLKVLVDQISSHSDFLYRLKDVSYAFN